jgi:hypothetical protein
MPLRDGPRHWGQSSARNPAAEQNSRLTHTAHRCRLHLRDTFMARLHELLLGGSVTPEFPESLRLRHP